MNIKDQLISNSPFLLQKTIKESDRFVFTDQELVINDNVVGNYVIEDAAGEIKITVENEADLPGTEMELQVTTDPRRILLYVTDLYTAYQLADCCQDVPVLVPMKRIVDDERAEL